MEDGGNDRFNLRGVLIVREVIEEKYNLKFNDTEWLIFRNNILKSWGEDEYGLRGLVFKHIREAFEKMDYKTKLDGKDIVFIKK